MVAQLLYLGAAYLLGAIPTGYVVGRVVAGVDVRRQGSGNVGATNVSRVAGKLPGLVVLLVDIGKGWLAASWLHAQADQWVGPLGTGALRALMGLAAVVGHNWPVFLRFQGGKGVATSAGVFLAVAPGALSWAAAVWVVTAVATRIVSVSSLLAAVSVPVVLVVQAQPMAETGLGVLLAGLIVLRHRANVRRLLAGQEPRLGTQTPFSRRSG